MPKKSLDYRYLEPVKAKRVKPHEWDDKDDPRINSFYMTSRELRSMRRALVKANPEGAELLYSKRVDGELRYGGENNVDLLPPEEYQELVRGRAAAKDISIERADAQLRAGLQGQGHVGIAVGFTKDGRTVEASARVNGEIHQYLEKAVANDKSGRFMSEKARPDATYEQVHRALTNVSKDMTRDLGIPVEAQMIKNTGRVRTNPHSAVAATQSVNRTAKDAATTVTPSEPSHKKAKQKDATRRQR